MTADEAAPGSGGPAAGSGGPAAGGTAGAANNRRRTDSGDTQAPGDALEVTADDHGMAAGASAADGPQATTRRPTPTPGLPVSGDDTSKAGHEAPGGVHRDAGSASERTASADTVPPSAPDGPATTVALPAATPRPAPSGPEGACADGFVLDVRGLSVAYGRSVAVRGVDLVVGRGEVVAVVGESGSGKSTLAQALLGLLPPSGRITAGRVLLGGRDTVGLSERELRRLRGPVAALVPQDPAASLDPVVRVGDQVAEALAVHGLAGRRQARRRAVRLLAEAGLSEAERLARAYPHELSGGQRQRVLIAAALACRPRLLIADEPTSALDTTVQRRVLDRLGRLVSEHRTAVLFITHDLAIAADRADRIAVMSAGRVVECGPVGQILGRPQHPRTQQLLDAARRAVTAPPPRPAKAGVLLAVDGLVREHRLRRTGPLRAVDKVSFTVERGGAFGLVGESGSGKSTTARLVTGLDRPTAGSVRFAGQEVGGRPRRQVQLVQQSPYASLDPRWTVRRIVDEPLRAHGPADRAARRTRVGELLDLVALDRGLLERRPGELSGGQRQRVAIARALAPDPELLVCDEPVSALDLSVQAQILDLLARLRAELGLALLLVSHDLGVVREMCEQVGVMRDGRLVEQGPADRVLTAPRHPYTRELLSAAPVLADRQSRLS
jgi:peptide/nickel transport system ATP-binding protein